MSTGLSHFSSEDIEHLSGRFHNMGREFTSSNGSGHYGFMPNSGHSWEDDVEDLNEEDVWGGPRNANHEENTEWNCLFGESDAASAYDGGGAAKSGKSKKSWLSLELQSVGLAGRKKEHVGVGFAAVEAVNGGWAPGFSSRKVKIPQMGGGGAGGSGYANGRHDFDVGVKRGGVPQSAPVSMPVWPVKGGYGDSGDVEVDNSCLEDGEAKDEEEDEDSDGDDQGGRKRRSHPHEIVDREYARSTTFSVIEGAGRTLKGIDQRRVRNAVWSCTGFED